MGIETITDNSEQINPLSLNVTIKAAWAGDAVNGFPVVANLIKDLTMQIAEASKDAKLRTEGI